MAEISAPEVLDVIRAIEKRGHYEVAAKSIPIAGQFSGMPSRRTGRPVIRLATFAARSNGAKLIIPRG